MMAGNIETAKPVRRRPRAKPAATLAAPRRGGAARRRGSGGVGASMAKNGGYWRLRPARKWRRKLKMRLKIKARRHINDSRAKAALAAAAGGARRGGRDHCQRQSSAYLAAVSIMTIKRVKAAAWR